MICGTLLAGPFVRSSTYPVLQYFVTDLRGLQSNTITEITVELKSHGW